MRTFQILISVVATLFVQYILVRQGFPRILLSAHSFLVTLYTICECLRMILLTQGAKGHEFPFDRNATEYTNCVCVVFIIAKAFQCNNHDNKM